MKKKKVNGFTLVELIVVIALISIIAVVAFPFIKESISNSSSKNKGNVSITPSVPVNNFIEDGVKVGANDNKAGINDNFSPEDNNVIIGNHDNTTINNYYVTADGEEISGTLLFNKIETKFEYSSDNGETWKPRLASLNVGSSYYMTVSMKVSQSVKTDAEQVIHADITFSDINANEISVEEAQGLKDWKGQSNEEEHTVTYPVEVIAGVDPAEFSVTFVLTPLTAGTFPVTVTYDDQINENWDKIVNLKYIEAPTEPPTTEPETTEPAPTEPPTEPSFWNKVFKR